MAASAILWVAEYPQTSICVGSQDHGKRRLGKDHGPDVDSGRTCRKMLSSSMESRRVLRPEGDATCWCLFGNLACDLQAIDLISSLAFESQCYCRARDSALCP